MVYLLYGLEEYLIDKQITKVLEEQKIEKINCNTYDLENSLLDEIIDDASTISLFADKKAIIVENSYIFTGTTNKKLPEQNLSHLEQYLQNINPDTFLIFKLVKETIDNRKKITTLMKKNGVVKEYNKVDNINSYVKEMLAPYQTDSSCLSLLIDRTRNRLDLLEMEIEKLKTYKDQDLNITKEDILTVTSKTVDIDIFNLIDNIVIRNKEQAIESYYEMLKLGEEPIKVIIMLANQFRMMYQAKQFVKQGYSEKEIASTLEVHPYRIKLALQKSRDFSESRLLNYLEMLADLDLQIKSGKIDKNIGLELFILQI